MQLKASIIDRTPTIETSNKSFDFSNEILLWYKTNTTNIVAKNT